MNKALTVLPLGPLMVDVEGTSLTTEEANFLCHPAVGAVILFRRNFVDKSQVKALIDEIKSLREPQLLVAVDQEGGRVQRFQKEFCRLPPLFELGQLYKERPDEGGKFARTCGWLMAAELIEIGIDFSFAPVLDLADLNSHIIGNRAFDNDPDAVVTIAFNYIQGMNEAGMQATGKHFPGHGGVIEDSHVQTPEDARNLSELMQSDLVPYLKLANQLGGIMTAHICYPNIDAHLPTFSSFWIKNILRQTVGFSGVVFSDDLSMEGALVIGDLTERAQAALTAGCDMALICNDPAGARLVADNLTMALTENKKTIESMRSRSMSISAQQLTDARNQVMAIC